MRKFDFCIGNPPYHYETGRRKIPLYPEFVMSASSPDVADVICLITPDGFIKGGQQLEPLRQYLEKNPHLKRIDFHKDQLFTGKAVDAAIVLFDNTHDYDEVRKSVTAKDGSRTESILDWKYRDVIVDSLKYDVQGIFDRIIASEHITMADLIPSWAPFGLNTKCYRSNKQKFASKRSKSRYVRILVGEEQDFYYINPHDDFSYPGSDGRIEFVKLKNAEKWKMVFPKAGFVKKKPLDTRILGPGEIFTDKYLCVFAESEQEAINVQKYFASKFYRAGLASKATSWILYRGWHANIPTQDFTNMSDIHWDSSSGDIDKQLYKKYGLREDEIKKIESYIW